MNQRTRKPLERDIQRAVIEAAALFGVTLHRRNTGMGRYVRKDGSLRHVHFGRAGDSDLTGTIPGDGRRIDVEVKRPGQRPTPKQLHALSVINALGGVGLWVNDAKQIADFMPDLLRGCRVYLKDGIPWITDEDDPK